jgi:hypothetical protein
MKSVKHQVFDHKVGTQVSDQVVHQVKGQV